MRIILVGQGPFGEKALDALIRNGEDIVGVFCPQNKNGEAMKELADSASIALFQPDHMRDPDVHEAYRELICGIYLGRGCPVGFHSHQ